MARYLIGIDDTDDLNSRGTGFRTRDLTRLVHLEKLANVSHISRHQLYVHQDIPFTSHNSSACLNIETEDIEQFKGFCVDYLVKESAKVSDVGLCIAPYDQISGKIINWGKRAKIEILTQEEAYRIACEEGIYLEGFLGTKGGIIGALAGVGLRKTGGDGRFFWINHVDLRELNGIYLTKELLEKGGFDQVISKTGEKVNSTDRIFTGEWLRPVLQNNLVTVLVEPHLNNNEYEWNIVSKEYIRSISD